MVFCSLIFAGVCVLFLIFAVISYRIQNQTKSVLTTYTTHIHGDTFQCIIHNADGTATNACRLNGDENEDNNNRNGEWRFVQMWKRRIDKEEGVAATEVDEEDRMSEHDSTLLNDMLSSMQ